MSWQRPQIGQDLKNWDAIHGRVPYVFVQRTANFSVAHNTSTEVLFTVATEMHPGPNNKMPWSSSLGGRIFAVVEGLWCFSCGFVWNSGSSVGDRMIRLIHSDGRDLGGDERSPGTASSNPSGTVVTPPVRMKIGDYMRMFAFQDSGAALDLLQGSTFDAAPWFCGMWLSP